MTSGSRRSGGEGTGEGWITIRGEISGVELDAACAGMGIAIDRERRRGWQRSGLFPLPAIAAGAADAGGSRRAAAYHRDSPTLAAYLDAMVPDESPRGRHESVRRAVEAIRLLRLRAGHGPRSEPGEDRFYVMVQASLAEMCARRRPPEPPEPPIRTRRRAVPGSNDIPRWTTLAGGLTAPELEGACRARGVHLDRSRRTYWQSERAFPQPERRLLHPPEGRGGARGYYHRGAVDLACLIDYAVRADHPAKTQPWRYSARDLGPVLASWREGVDEEAFFRRVAATMPLIVHGEPVPGIMPRHRDVLPARQQRVGEAERGEALDATARVSEAIADSWVADHATQPVPERLVVWFRLERAGPDDWRIADAGARPTSHSRQRGRDGGASAGPG